MWLCVSAFTCMYLMIVNKDEGDCLVMILGPSVPTKQNIERGGGRDGEERLNMMRWCFYMRRSWKRAADIKHPSSPVNQARQWEHALLQESCSNVGPFWDMHFSPHVSSVAKWHKCMSWTLLLRSWRSHQIHPKVPWRIRPWRCFFFPRKSSSGQVGFVWK